MDDQKIRFIHKNHCNTDCSRIYLEKLKTKQKEKNIKEKKNKKRSNDHENQIIKTRRN